MNTTQVCPICGKPVVPGAPQGLCPECLMKSGFETGGGNQPGEGKSSFVPPAIEEMARLFPQLEIIELLGRGGMGAVYKARQPRLNRFVALKILSPEKQKDPQFAERFEREARALASLTHPNIVTVYDFGEVQAHFYLLMEFVDGLTLRQLLQTQKLSPAEALGVVPKICEALQFAHEQGVIHRDIKPENILLDKKGRVKIADFGIAKIMDLEPGNLSLTGAKDVVGTPHYMAPEQIEKPQSVDNRADIFSLGVVFYEMLTGELPLGKFAPPSKKVQIDVRLDEVVLRALEKEPERRYQQASQVKTAVETITADTTKSEAKADQRYGDKTNPMTGVPLFPVSFGLTFRSQIALKMARTGWVLGCLAALGFLGFIPGWAWLKCLFSFSGFFGLIGFAVLIEVFHRRQHGIPIGEAPATSPAPKPDRFWRRFAIGVAAVLLAMILIPIIVVLLAMFVPAFTRQDRVQAVVNERTVRQNVVTNFYIGQTWFPRGDSIEITSVDRSTSRIVVKGRYNLVSADKASLTLHICQTNGAAIPDDVTVGMSISRGRGDFELVDPNSFRGFPHVDISSITSGWPMAQLYFGTRTEALAESKLELPVYLGDDVVHGQTTDRAPRFGPVHETILPAPDDRTRTAKLLDLDTGAWATNTEFGANDRETHAWIRSNRVDVLGVIERGQIGILSMDMAVVPAPSNGWDTVSAEAVLTNWGLNQQEPHKITPLLTVLDHTDTWLFRTREEGHGVLQILGQSKGPTGVKIRYKLVQPAGRMANEAASPLAERQINKLVSEFPERRDLSTPESACAAWQRASAREDAQAICDLSLTPLNPESETNWYRREAARDPQSMAIYLKALAESKILVVQTYSNELANVITYLPFPKGKGQDPYSARGFGRVNGQWKNLGEDRLPDLEAAKADFIQKKEGLWRQFVELKARNLELAAATGEQAELMKLVEDFFQHNFRDVTARKSLEWGKVQTNPDGSRSIRYKYEAKIWDRDTIIANQEFTFDAQGKFLSYTNIAGFPKPKTP